MPALSCLPTYSRELVILTVAGVLGSSAFVVTLISYIYILLAILCMNSSESRHKAFSTCGSYLGSMPFLWDHHLHICVAFLHLLT